MITIYIGFLAGILTTFAAIPQIIKSYKNKSAWDLSFYMFLSVILGQILWIYYGTMIVSVPIIVWNIVGFSLNGIILIQKVYYDRKNKLGKA